MLGFKKKLDQGQRHNLWLHKEVVAVGVEMNWSRIRSEFRIQPPSNDS